MQVHVGTNPYKLRAVEETVQRLQEKVRHTRAEAKRSSRLAVSRAASNQEHEAIETQTRQAEIELREQEAELLYLRKIVTPEQRAMLEARAGTPGRTSSWPRSGCGRRAWRPRSTAWCSRCSNARARE